MAQPQAPNAQEMRRQELHSRLKQLPVKQVWFQKPENRKLEYPCILYHWDRIKYVRADNIAYHSRRGYLVTLIDYCPDSSLPDDFQRMFPTASFDRPYVADGLNHWVYTLFF